MYEELKYGVSFSVDARVELIFGMLSKLKKEYPNILEKEDKKLEEELDYIEVSDTKYADKFYEVLDFKKYPKLMKWAVVLSDISDCGVIPNICMIFDEDFSLKNSFNLAEFSEKYEKYNCGFLINNLDEFINDINEFVENENYLEFYKSCFGEYNKMIKQSTKQYPDNLDIKDIEKCYGEKLPKYPVIYSIFFNGGFGPRVDGIPTCFKGLCVENGEYIETTSNIVNLFHEYSHPFINPLVDKYWDNFENVTEFVNYSVENNLHPTYQEDPKALYYEYFVRVMAHILSSNYEDCTRFIESFKKIGFVKFEEMIEFVTNNFQIGDNFEEFFANEIIPFTNNITNNLKSKRY